MALKFWLRNKTIIVYGISLAGLMFLLKWLELRLLIISYTVEIYVGAIAIIFTSLGIWLALKLAKPKVTTIIVEKEVFVESKREFVFNEAAFAEYNISKRELEVLQLMADGLSNQQIAERLFISLHTVKTHSSKLFEKLEVQRRTQAVDKAKSLRLIA